MVQSVDLGSAPRSVAGLGVPPVSITTLTPSNPDGAPITFVESDFPGLAIAAGVLCVGVFPPCGCDACDDDLDDLAREMEELVLAVADGRFAETVTSRVGAQTPGSEGCSRGDRTVAVRREIIGRSSSTQTVAVTDEIIDGEQRLAQLADGRWQPWVRS